MAKKHSLLLTGLITISALGALTLLLTAPSWSSPALLFVTTAAPETLAETSLTLRGGGFSQTTHLWLVPERSIRSATTATLETFGNPHHFIRRNDHLYVANGVGGFFIVQGLQSPTPSISGVLNSGGQGVEVVLHRNEALLAAGNGGLQIIDIRDDANPQLLAVLKSNAPALSVASTDKIAYVAAGKSGVEIIDLTDPSNPRRRGALADVPEAYRLSCDEKTLIIATATGGWIYDLSQPEQPRRLAALPVPGGYNTVMTRQGETLYWATKSSRESRLYSLDLSRPDAPRVLSSVPLSGVPLGISCSDQQLAIALGSSGTQFISLASGSRLEPSPTIPAKSKTRFALLLGSALWVADSGGELLRLDSQGASALTAPPTLADFSPRLRPIVTPQLLFLGDKTGLSIYDRWDNAAPILLARLPMTGLKQQYLSADQRRLWLAVDTDDPATPGKLVSVDISRLHAPRITAEIPLAHSPEIIGEQGTTLVITTPTRDQPQPLSSAERLSSLLFIDTSQPQSPFLFSAYPLTAVSAGLNMTDHFVVLMQADGLLRVIDLSAPDAPQELGSLQMPWLQTAAWSGQVDIVVKDHVAFISSLLGKIFLVDLHDLRRPKNLGSFTLKGPVTSLLISDRFLLAEVKKEGLVVIDLKNIPAPAILGTIPLPGLLHNSIIREEDLWYISPDTNGIWSLPLPRRLQKSSVTDDRLVASLEQQPPAGAYRFWLTDQQNHLLVPGVAWSRPR